jgi:membrane protease YdiL (CAAX protease family)
MALDSPGPSGALAGLVLTVGGLSLVPLVIFLARHIFPGRNVFFARWGFSHVLVVVGAALVFGAAAGAVAGAREWPLPEVLVALLGSCAAFSGVALLIATFAIRLDPAGWRSLGLWRGRSARAVAVGLVSYALLYPAQLGLLLLWPWTYEALGGEYEMQAVAQGIAALDGRHIWMALCLASVIIPLLEELIFRAFLQPLLVQNLGNAAGIVLTSILFAILHGPAAFLPIFALSLLLGAIMLRTQRLLAVWVVHALHNALSFSFLFAVKP